MDEVITKAIVQFKEEGEASLDDASVRVKRIISGLQISSRMKQDLSLRMDQWKNELIHLHSSIPGDLSIELDPETFKVLKDIDLPVSNCLDHKKSLYYQYAAKFAQELVEVLF